ncbi:MAG: leucine-rich repeat domain-containing protein [bacterium]|nr:leucine-rich repeat domain-containing protein [bacterium]
MFVQSGGFAYISFENPQDPETAPAGYVVNIPDANLKAALNAILANVNGTTRTPTQNITAGELRAPNMAHFRDATTLAEKGITNLEGIQFLTQAQTIRLNNSNLNVPNRNIIANLEPLKDLKKLTELRLAFNNISNITPLGNITSLKELHLTSNSAISDISALSSLVNLEAIFMSHLPNTKTIEPLRPLTKLRNVQFSSNNVTDLSPIQGKTTIEYLYINTNKFTNFEVLSTLTNLKNLEISNTGIKDITVLAPLTQLQHLSLWFNDQIADFSTLARLTALKYLNIQKTNFKDSDVVYIASLPALNELRARENQLSDLSALAHYSFVANSTFNDQKKTLDTVYVPVIPNPIKNRDGSIVPVTETADVENVDAAGNPNPNGGYLKIKKTGQGTVTVNWNENAGINSFSGILTIPYNINLTPPTVTLTSQTPITATNVSNYTLAGTCSEIGKPVIIIIGNLSPMTINCEAGGTFSKTGIDVSSLAEGDVAIVASQTNASNVEGKVEVTVKKDQT